MNLITTGIRDQATVRALSSFQNQINAANLRGLFSARPNTAPFGAWYHCSDISPAAHANELYWYAGDSVGWLLMYGDGGTGGKPAGPDGAVQFSDGGAFGGQAELLWDKVNDNLGILGTLSVEKAATGADTTLVWVKNPSTAYTALAAEVIEADASNAVLALVQFGSHYTSAPEFQNYSAIYAGSLSSALMLGALGPAANVEFWLYDSGYAGDHWRHILDVQRGGVIPAAQDAYTLGLSSNRWSDVQTKALHVNGYALTMTGAAALNQNLLTTSSPTFVGLTARNVDLTGWNPTGDGLHLGYVGGATGSGIVSYKYSSVAAYLALTCDALAHYWDLSGTLKMTLDTSGLTLATALARGANAITGSGDLGATGTYIGNAYVTRHYLNSTAYLDGATAGAVVAFASILKTYYASGDARFIISPDGAQGRRSVLSLYANFTGTGDNVARRVADIVGGYVGAWTGEYIGFEVGGSDNSFIETTERMRLTSTGLSLSSGVAFVGEYQTQTGAWAAPSGGTNGRIVTVYNSTQAASRLYVYSNGGWHYSALT